jgi:hypothetical protein
MINVINSYKNEGKGEEEKKFIYICRIIIIPNSIQLIIGKNQTFFE